MIAGELADMLDAAAGLIEVGGLARDTYFGEYHDYEPGASCCVIGALGVAAGYTTSDQVDREFVGEAHPLLHAFEDHGDFDCPDAVVEWSDSANEDEVLSALRTAAAGLRQGGAG